MEFAIPAWSPWTRADTEILEKVQMRAVNQISGLQGRSYEEKLKELGLNSLESKRERFDLIHTFKILNGNDAVDSGIWFRQVGNEVLQITRNTSYHRNLVPTRSKTDQRNYFFSNRVVEVWNALPIPIKEAPTLNKFKLLLDEHRGNQ